MNHVSIPPSPRHTRLNFGHVLRTKLVHSSLGDSWRWALSIPYVWILLFFFIPFFIIAKVSFSETIAGAPPYGPLVSWVEGHYLQITLSLEPYLYIFHDPLYATAYLSSLKVAFVATVLTLLLGYPMAYGISRTEGKLQWALLVMVTLPFWTSFLIRIYAWIGILKPEGLLNSTLLWMGVIDTPLEIYNTQTAVYIGLVYCYLPFMVFPLYASLERMDTSLLEAAEDLGARPWRVFLTITLPLSRSGVVAGCALVFIPVIGEFVIPYLLGGAETLMIGKVLWAEFFSNRDWPVASAVAIIMLLVLVLPIWLFQRSRSAQEQHAAGATE